MNDFGKRLRFLREQNEVPMSKLVEDLGLNKSAISRYENGKIEPGLTVLLKISNYFNVTLDWLCGNGDINNIQFSGKKKYESAINECIKEGITPDQIVDIIKIVKR